MRDRIIDPFRVGLDVSYEHICRRCETVFDGQIAREVVDIVVHHKCHSTMCLECAGYHPSGLNRVHLYRVRGGDMDFGIKCHLHAVRFYGDAIRDAQTEIVIEHLPHLICPIMCADCTGEVGE